MRKGKGVLTYSQALAENKKLEKRIAVLEKENEKLRLDLHSRTVAYNKLLKGDREK